MSSAAQAGHAERTSAEASIVSPLRLPVAVLLGCCLVLALTSAKALMVWRIGIFLDPDDAMRAVEVRDFLAGQGWFDMIQHRMAPGHGVPMHWSRLADLPLAAGIELLRPMLGFDTAERVVRLIQPIACLVAFMTALARLGGRLLGRWGVLAVSLLAACCLETVGVFIPGHIHHHALQVMLLMVLGTLTVGGVSDPKGRAARAGWAGGVSALTMAINLQNLPFVLVTVAAFGLGWVIRGAAFDRALRSFALASMAGTGAVFLLQVPPDHYLAPTRDAFGAPHLLAFWIAGAGLLTLAVSSRLLGTPIRRGLAAVLLGAVLLAALQSAYPGCLGDPYAGVDPLLRTRWLDDVGEAMPLGRLLVRDPLGTIPIVAALTLGLAFILAAAWRSQGERRVAWLVVAGFAIVGTAGTVWEVRVAASVEPFAALGAAWALCRWFDPARPRKPLAALLCVLSGLGLTQAGWAAALPRLTQAFDARPGSIAAGPRVDAAACLAPADYEQLAMLPPGLVLSTIDPGSQILATTPHAVLAAPYHRNAYGNRLSLLAFDAEPDAAKAMVLAAGVAYVVICLTSPEVIDDARRAPDGLAARLAAGDVPAWLRPVASGAGPIRTFAVVR